MRSITVSWMLLIFSFSLLFSSISEARHVKKLPSAAVVGTVYCDTCSQQDFSETSHFISGAPVAIKCEHGNSKKSFYQEVKTNQHGVFQVHLPTAVSKDVGSIKRCSVKLISSSEPSCAVASSAVSSALHLKGRKDGTHIFSAGVFTFKPLKQPEICNQKSTVPSSKEFSPNKAMSINLGISTFPPTAPTLPTIPTVPTVPTIPSIPTVPTIPTIPTVPTIPTIPLLPFLPPLTPPLTKTPNLQPKVTESSKKNSLSDQKTLQPTSLLFPPIIPPIFPSPPPTIGGIPLPPNPFEPPPLLPNPLQPPPTSIIPPIIPIPFLTPPPPPPQIFPGLPPLPSLPPLPPLPPLIPGFPGIPPASPAKKSSP